ncbi:MAG: hypothetical protein U0S48_04050 [Solirubrobacteraceae bacterium]
MPTSASRFRAAATIPYARAKREAEVEALRLAAHGLAVVIVNPGFVFGRGDVNRSSTELVRRFLRRDLPGYVDGALNIVDAEDVARPPARRRTRRAGRALHPRQPQLHAGPPLRGPGTPSVEPPALKLPLPAALALARAAEAMPGRPAVTVDEVRAAAQWWAYRSNKARRELGWKPSHHEDTLQATIDWYREREPQWMRQPGTRQPLALRVAGGVVDQAGGLLGRLLP